MSNPDFQQGIDSKRPHTLLTIDTRFSGSLSYRYEDTGQVVSVPNIWYNQPYHARVWKLRADAKQQETYALQADKIPFGCTPEAAAASASYHRERAAEIGAYADRMEAAGSLTHPVAASHMPFSDKCLVPA